jgi:hypothetical protein
MLKTTPLPPLLDPPPYTERGGGKELRAWALDKYLLGYKQSDIAKALGLPLNNVHYWSKADGWDDAKDEAAEDAIREVVVLSADRIKTTLANTLTVIERNVKHYKEQDEPLTISEVDKLTNIFERLFKVSQLVTGNPTEIFQGENITIHTILAKLKEVDVIEYK